MVEITIYTAQGAIEYTVKKPADNFAALLAAALEKGYVAVETAEGSSLIINPLNVVAIEIRDVEAE